jgi:hypothetical protein
LEPDRQRAELARILSIGQNTAERSRIAAQVIKAYVDSGRRDLVALRKDLQLALR